MVKQVNIYRHEIKYFINRRQAAELRLFLRKNMDLDKNSDDTGSYWIRSLYFDTIDNKDYYEKINGHNIRKKIRLRIYNIDTSTVKLEIKNKYNNYMLKESVSISREEANKFINGDSSFLLNYNQKVTNKIFTYMHTDFYRPNVIIDYEREAYYYPFQSIRVTLDKNICANFSSQDLFNENISMIPVLNNNLFVLEVKYNHMIPVILQKALSTFVIQKSQISKYCLGRNILGK